MPRRTHVEHLHAVLQLLRLRKLEDLTQTRIEVREERGPLRRLARITIGSKLRGRVL